jgi:MtrB/PioB family decaheme-associated outer membrane protein
VRNAMPALLLALWAAASAARADPPRNALHPGNADLGATPDPRGMSALHPHRLRSPSGLLYPFPPAPTELSEIGAGWLGRVGIEVGGFLVGGDEDETRFATYVERKDGALVDLVNLELRAPERGDYWLLRAGSLARDDQFYELDAGRAGWLRVRGAYSGVPRRYASDAVLLYGGGDELRLRGGLAPGGSTPEALQAFLADASEHQVELQRNQGQLEARLRVLPELSLVGQLGLIDRHGATPTGVGFAFPEYSTSSGGTIEVVSPVDDRTYAARAGLEWAGETAQLNVGWLGSFYRNQRDALALEQPFENLGIAPVDEARLALAPDNDRNELRAELGLALPLRSRLAGTVSWARTRQDEDLLPPTVNGAQLGSIDLADWSTRAALSQDSADASIDQVLLDVDLFSSPWRPLRLRAGFRYADQDTDNDYTARNPETGEIGYVVEDGGHGATLGEDFAGVYRPGTAGSRWRYRAIPFGQRRTTWDVGATWTAPLRSALDLGFAQEHVHRDVSEVEDTREERWSASLSTRGLGFGSARISYQYVTRDGSEVDYDVYDRYSTEGLPGYVPSFPDGEVPHSLEQLVRPSVADLRGQRWRATVTLPLGPRSDLLLSGRLRSQDYGPDYGLLSDRSRDLEAEWTLQVSPALSASLFGSLGKQRRSMRNIRGFASSPDGNAGGPSFPFSNEWATRTEGTAIGWGGGLQARPFARLELASSCLFLVTRDEIDLEFASLSALASPDFASPPPDHLPELRSRDTALESSARLILRPGLALRLYYRYERSTIDDFHQTGLPVVVGRRVYLGHEDGDFEASFYGVGLQAEF